MTVSRQQLRTKYFPTPVQPVAPDAPAAGLEVERAFVHHADSGRTIITAPVRETAAANAGFLYLHGRFVEADTPNRNGAMWTSEDLELAQATVAGGPLNWLHDETHIVGTLLDGRFQAGREAAAGEPAIGNHIVSTAALWRFLFPQETAIVEKAAADARLYYSMECVSETVTCVSGCGADFGYKDFLQKAACGHLNSRESAVRFNQPTFLGGALIVPPVEPGWARADVDIVRQAAALTEQHGLEGALSRPQAEAMVERVLTWANRA
jgi:hypothetical protein